MAGGGAERQLTYLAKELVQARCDVHVALVQGGPNLERLEATGVTIHRLRSLGNHDPRILAQLLATIKAIHPDLVHCWLLQMEVFGGVAATLSGTPWVLSERSSEAAYPPTWKNRLRVRVASHASGIVSNSDAGEQYWAARANGRISRYVIPNALPLEEIDAAPPATDHETGLPTGTRLVLSAGRIDEGKNVEALVRAVGLIADRSVGVICCGDGPLRASLERFSAEQGLTGRVRLVGYVPHLWSLMKRAAVLVSSSRFEGRPNVVLEAMACGCPLVVSDIPAHREFLDERSAIFVDANDSRGIADAIVSVLSDPVAAATRARVARDQVQQLSTAVIVQEYIRVYRQVLAIPKDRHRTPVF
jgi:glycosyltransferase involved in cell wall biosynthesis